MCTPSMYTLVGIRIVPVMAPVKSLEYIDRRTCVGMFWAAAPSRPQDLDI